MALWLVLVQVRCGLVYNKAAAGSSGVGGGAACGRRVQYGVHLVASSSLSIIHLANDQETCSKSREQ